MSIPSSRAFVVNSGRFNKTEKRSTEIDGYTNILLDAVESQADSDDSSLARGVEAIRDGGGT